MFNRVGVIAYPKDKGSDDAMLETALDVGAEECDSDEEEHEFLTSPEDFATVRDALEAKLGAPATAGIFFRPQNTVAVSDSVGETLMKLIDILDDNDDVQRVTGNYELSDALVAKLAG
jgi:transcriptional/translational regulatory protein YebC/TACO1